MSFSLGSIEWYSTGMSQTQLQPGLSIFLLLYVASTNHVSLSELGKIEFLVVENF